MQSVQPILENDQNICFNRVLSIAFEKECWLAQKGESSPHRCFTTRHESFVSTTSSRTTINAGFSVLENTGS